MAKLTKQQAKMHAQACALLEKDVLSHDDKLFVLEHWQEGANHVNGVAGAFFTPQSLARDFAIEVCGSKIIDLCAGIGSLSFAYLHSDPFARERKLDITCVELNPDYIAVGKKILPEATWIQANILELPADFGNFNCAIPNPPFGNIKAQGKAPRYKGNDFEYAVLDVTSDIADYGIFLIPQTSAPFQLSGVRSMEYVHREKYERFENITDISLEANCGIDTGMSLNDWHGVSVTTEIVVADFKSVRALRLEKLRPVQEVLFSAA